MTRLHLVREPRSVPARTPDLAAVLAAGDLPAATLLIGLDEIERTWQSRTAHAA